MVASADIVVQGPDGTTQLIVEIKNKVPASADWAARMRRNLFAHLSLPQARFFLLCFPNDFICGRTRLHRRSFCRIMKPMPKKYCGLI